MKQSLKIGFVTLVVAGVTASGLALAQSNGGDETVPPADNAQVEEFEGRSERGERGKHRGGRHLGQVADILGIEDPTEIRETLEAGGTLADLAVANGSSGSALVDELVAGVEAKLDEAVADGRIDQETADEKLAEASEKITTMVNSTLEEMQAAREAARVERQAEREARRAERQQTVADVIGITVEELEAEMEAGDTTLAELAEANGVPLDDLVAGLTASAVEHLDEKVADGTLTEEEAAEKLANLTERITERVQSEPGDGPGEGRRGPGRRGPGRGGPGAGGDGFGPPTVEDAAVGVSA